MYCSAWRLLESKQEEGKPGWDEAMKEGRRINEKCRKGGRERERVMKQTSDTKKADGDESQKLGKKSHRASRKDRVKKGKITRHVEEEKEKK